MANKTFVADAPFMPDSIVGQTNGIWCVELFKNWLGNFEVRFARECWSSFGSIWDDGLFHFSVDGAGIPPKYVLDYAMRMWKDNVG
jgi:hypothetical protein